MIDILVQSLGPIALILSLVGAFFNARKKIVGFYIWTLSNIFWILLNVHLYIQGNPEVVSQIIMFLIYSILNFYGIYQWKKMGP